MEQNLSPQTNDKQRNILIIIGVIVLCCCLGFLGGYFFLRNGLNQLFVQDPVEAAQVAHEMVDYTLPVGAAMNIFGMGEMVMITGNQSQPMIMLMQFNSAVGFDEEEMRRQMQTGAAQSGNVSVTLVETRTMFIRGQQVPVSIYEGQDQQGNAIRQLVTIFDGKSGPIMLMIMGSPYSWNDGEIGRFLLSIR